MSAQAPPDAGDKERERSRSRTPPPQRMPATPQMHFSTHVINRTLIRQELSHNTRACTLMASLLRVSLLDQALKHAAEAQTRASVFIPSDARSWRALKPNHMARILHYLEPEKTQKFLHGSASWNHGAKAGCRLEDLSNSLVKVALGVDDADPLPSGRPGWRMAATFLEICLLRYVQLKMRLANWDPSSEADTLECSSFYHVDGPNGTYRLKYHDDAIENGIDRQLGFRSHSVDVSNRWSAKATVTCAATDLSQPLGPRHAEAFLTPWPQQRAR